MKTHVGIIKKGITYHLCDPSKKLLLDKQTQSCEIIGCDKCVAVIQRFGNSFKRIQEVFDCDTGPVRRMKNINELKLSKKAKIIVQTWLEEWLNTFLAQADGKEGTVYRANFREADFFYFTDCNDILFDNPESVGVEANTKILKRKRAVMNQLLIKTLLGTVKLLKNKCSHCGYANRYIEGLPNGMGHFLYCPNCKYTTVGTYPDGYENCMAIIKGIVTKKNLDKKLKCDGRAC